ncbi:MAG: LruC domain-containing protein [Bacteroidota bacterium]|nr:LruC domain-containing protein [Bacteroidota bacterium]
MKKQIYIILFGLMLTSLFSCTKENGTTNEPQTDSFESMVISDNFEFKTTQEINLQIQVIDQVTSVIEIYNGHPNQDGVLIKKGITDSDNSYETLLVLSNNINEIYAIRYSFDGSVQSEMIPVSSSNLVYHFGYKNLKSASIIANLVDNGDFEDNPYTYLFEINLQSNISSSNLDNWILKTYQSNKPNSEIYSDNGNNVVQMTDNKTNKETFAYYYLLADPNVEYTLDVDGIIITDLGSLAPYMSLQFMSANGQIINDYYQEFTSTTWTTKTITQTSPANTVYIKVVMATTVSGKGEAWFDNVNLTGSPAVADADNDGVPDSLDEFPSDPDRAFNSYYPNSIDYSSFAFEDLWPNMGDYDFNDLVINFQYKTVTNAGNNIVDLIAKFKIKAAGASFNNGFGFAFDALPATVASVTGTQILGSIVQIAANGLEDGHITQSVVIVYDKINNYTGTDMLNTDPNIAIIDIALTTVTINFSTPQASIGTEPYNPFIFIDETRGREVHLVNNEPTELVDLSYFGTADDVSSVANSIFYKTFDNYPFALETPVPMDYTTEKDDIVTAHLKFATWAESSGSSYQDWYVDQPGYRNNNKIRNN